MEKKTEHLISMAAFNPAEIADLNRLIRMKFLSFNHVDGQPDCVVINIGKNGEDADRELVSQDKFDLVKYLQMAGVRSGERTSKGKGPLSAKTEIYEVLVRYYKFTDFLKLLELLNLTQQDVLIYNAPNYEPTDTEQ